MLTTTSVDDTTDSVASTAAVTVRRRSAQTTNAPDHTDNVAITSHPPPAMPRSAGPSQLVSIESHRPNNTKAAATSVQTNARNNTPIFRQMVTS